MGYRTRLNVCLLLAITSLLYYYMRYFSDYETFATPKNLGDGAHGLLQDAFQGQLPPWSEAPSKSDHNLTVTLVVPRRKSEDTSWLDLDLPLLSKAVYTVDDRSAPLRPPANKGNEAMVYLSYIIDFYDRLPEISIFMHAHRWAWHNGDLMDHDMVLTLRLLNLNYVKQQGYMNLRCQWYPGCPEHLHPAIGKLEDPAKKEEALLATVWQDLFPKRDMPDTLAQPCCSQFAVTRERIHSVPRDEYIRLRDWLLKTKIRDSMSGRLFEYTWQLLFTGENIWCPSQHMCHCNAYGLCFEHDTDFGRFLDGKVRMKQEEWDLMERIESNRITEEEEKAWRRRLDLAYWRFAMQRDAAVERGRKQRTGVHIEI